MSEAAPLEITLDPPKKIDRYEIEGILGRGGFGTVYRGRHSLTRQPVALKVLRMAALAAGHGEKDIVREAQMMGAIKHKNVASVYDAGIADGMAFFAMELVEGPTLDSVLQTHGPMPFPNALPIALQLLDGIAAAHASGVVHRDIKPGNLVLLADGTLKILDFGISRSSFVSASAPSQSNLAGTPGYMAPEQFGDGPIDHRADIYAAAATLYKLTTNTLPFSETNFADLLARVMRDAAPSLRTRLFDAPPFFIDAIDRGLARDPAARFSSALEFRAALSGQASFAAPTTSGFTPSGTAATISQSPAYHVPSNPPLSPSPYAPPPMQMMASMQSGPSMQPMQLATPASSPLKWALMGGIAVALLLVLGVAAGAAMFLLRSGNADHANASGGGGTTPATFSSGVEIGPVKTTTRTGTFTTTQTCNENQTIHFEKAVFDVKNGPAIATDDNCDLELTDTDIRAPIGIHGPHVGLKIHGGTITTTGAAIDVEIGDIEIDGTRINAAVGIRAEGPGKIILTKVAITAHDTALDLGINDLTLEGSTLTAPTGIHLKGPSHGTVHGGEIKSTGLAFFGDGIVDVTFTSTKVEGHVKLGTLAKVHGLSSKP